MNNIVTFLYTNSDNKMKYIKIGYVLIDNGYRNIMQMHFMRPNWSWQAGAYLYQRANDFFNDTGLIKKYLGTFGRPDA